MNVISNFKKKRITDTKDNWTDIPGSKDTMPSVQCTTPFLLIYCYVRSSECLFKAFGRVEY